MSLVSSFIPATAACAPIKKSGKVECFGAGRAERENWDAPKQAAVSNLADVFDTDWSAFQRFKSTESSILDFLPLETHNWNHKLHFRCYYGETNAKKEDLMRHVLRKINLGSHHVMMFGPRGTGKSTFLKRNYSGALYIDLLSPDDLRTYSARPELLRELVEAHPEKSVVIVDEIQKVPDLLSVIHLLIERHDGKQFIVTGSSSRKLRKQGVNLLAGRAYKKRMHPFTAQELGRDFSILDALQFGMIPVVYSSPDKKAALAAYVDLYVREEVMMEGLTRNIGSFSRFLEAVSFSHGGVLNITNVARECQVNRKVVESYIAILEDLLLAYKVPVFSRRAKRQLTVQPKLFLYDTGLFQELRPSGPLDRASEIDGAALEGLVFQHLNEFVDRQEDQTDLYFWRTKSGNEVDFILYGTNVFAAVEVKNTDKIRPSDLVSLKSFSKDYEEAKTILVYRGSKRINRDNILVVPAEEFLMDMERHIT